MASISSPSLDDQLVGDGDASFLRGQVSSSSEDLVPKGAFYDAVNMDIDASGRLQTRRGARTTSGNAETRNWEDIATNWESLTTIFGSSLGSIAVDGCFYFDTYASEYIVIAQNGGLLQGTEGGVYASISGSSYSGSDVYFGQLNNRLYYCDGTGALKYVDSSIANNSITAGKVTSIKITTQGSGYTSVPAITFSSGAAAATAVLGYGGKVVGATVTTPSSGYSATTPPTISFAAAPAGGVTAVGRVNISQIPSKPKLLVSHINRLFCTSADTAIPPDTIYASDILDGESWDLVGASLRVGGDGDPITGIYPWFGNRLLVFKQRSIWYIDADPLLDVASWEVKLINNRIGCVAHRTIQSVGADVYFLAQDGVRNVSQIQSGSQTDVGEPKSAVIQDEIDAINRDAISKCCAAFHRNRYFLAVPAGTATSPDTVLVWNELAQAWLGAWTGWQPREFCISGFGGRIRLNFADSSGKLWTWDDFTPVSDETSSIYRDDTTDYPSYIVTRGYNHQEPLVNKAGYSVQAFTENRLTDTPATAYLYYDMDASGVFTALDTSITVAAGDRQRRLAYNLTGKGKYNVIQFKFGTAMRKIALTGIAVTAFPDAINPQF